MLKYYFTKYSLPNEAVEKFRPIGVYNTTNTVEDLVNKAVESNHGMPKAQMLAAVNLFMAEVAKALERGESVNTEIFNARPIISGVYDSVADTIDTTKTPVKISFTAGVKAKEAADKVTFQRIDNHSIDPQIFEIIDNGSDTINTKLTPGNFVTINGYRIKIDTDREDNGLFLVSNGRETKIDLISHNAIKKVVATLPTNLTPGEYEVVIRTSLSASGQQTKTLRKTSFRKSLKVE